MTSYALAPEGSAEDDDEQKEKVPDSIFVHAVLELASGVDGTMKWFQFLVGLFFVQTQLFDIVGTSIAASEDWSKDREDIRNTIRFGTVEGTVFERSDTVNMGPLTIGTGFLTEELARALGVVLLAFARAADDVETASLQDDFESFATKTPIRARICMLFRTWLIPHKFIMTGIDLLNHSSGKDIVMNSVALTFIFELDNVFYSSLVPAKVRNAFSIKHRVRMRAEYLDQIWWKSFSCTIVYAVGMRLHTYTLDFIMLTGHTEYLAGYNMLILNTIMTYPVSLTWLYMRVVLYPIKASVPLAACILLCDYVLILLFGSLSALMPVADSLFDSCLTSVVNGTNRTSFENFGSL